MAFGIPDTELTVKLWEETISASKHFDARFIGSFFAMDQLPNDRKPQIAVAGRSNVGKSSLLNRLLGRRKLAKVSSTPGKTRSLNFFLVSERFHFVDLPGYGYAKVAKSIKAEWGKLIEKYLTTAPHLVGLILLIDCRRDITAEDRQLIDWLTERQLPLLVALTKSDKLSKAQLGQKVSAVETEIGADVIATSVVSGLGKKELVSAVSGLVGQFVKI